MTFINDDWLAYDCERLSLIKHIEKNLNQVNRDYFEGIHGILSVTDNGDYVTIKGQGSPIADYDPHRLFDALESFGQEVREFLCPYGLWEYLDHCKYTLPEDQKLFVKLEDLLDEIDCTYFSHCRSKVSIEQQNDEIVNIRRNDECLSFFIKPLVTSLNVSDIDHSFDDLWDYLEWAFQYHGVKSDNELSISEKREVKLIDILLSVPVPITESSGLDDWTISLISQSQPVHTEASTLSELVEELEQKNKILWEKNRELEQNKEQYEAGIDILNQRVHDLESTVYLLQQETNQITVLNESVTQLHIRIYKLEQENKQLKNQSEPQPEPKPEPEPTTKKRPKFKLPENFADYQQECDNLINALSYFYNIKKGKWNGNILQFILTPTDAQKAKHLYPDKWKAGLYLQPGQWTVDKVSMSDPDEWQEHFMDVYDFADSSGIEIS